MPWTQAQRRAFAVKYRNGEMDKKTFDRMMSEGVKREPKRSKRRVTKRRAR